MQTKFEPETWDWWTAALEAKSAGHARTMIGSDDLPIHQGRPHTGFYRLQTNSGGPKVPISFWFEDGDLRCHSNGMEQDEASARGRWEWAARDPISYEEYTAYMTAMNDFREDPTGHSAPVWSDEIQVTAGGKTSSTHEKPKRAPKVVEEGAEPKRRGRPKKSTEPVMQYFHNAETRDLHSGYEHPGGAGYAAIDKAEFDELAIQYANPAVEEDLNDDWDDGDSDDALIQHQQEEQKAKDLGLDRDGALATAMKAAGEYSETLDAKAIAAEVKARVAKPKPEPAVPAPDSVEGRPEPAPAGHNSGGDRFAEVSAELVEWKQTLAKMVDAGTPKDKKAADLMADAQTKLGEVIKEADGLRTTETKPLRDRVDAINLRWNNVIRPANLVKDSAKAPIKRFIDLQKEIEADRRRKADAAEREAAAASGQPQEASTEARKPREEYRPTVGGRRAVGTVRRRVAIIEDVQQVAAYFASQEKVAPELMQLLQQLAQKVLTAGVSIPGARLDTQEGVR